MDSTTAITLWHEMDLERAVDAALVDIGQPWGRKLDGVLDAIKMVLQERNPSTETCPMWERSCLAKAGADPQAWPRTMRDLPERADLLRPRGRGVRHQPRDWHVAGRHSRRARRRRSFSLVQGEQALAQRSCSRSCSVRGPVARSAS
ncbi:MAG: hypothetical protein U0359_21605 [Byssovorax sp.]